METMNFPKVWKTGTVETKTTTKKMKIMTSKMVLPVVPLLPAAEMFSVLVAGFVAKPDITAARALCSTADLAVVRRMRRKMTRNTKKSLKSKVPVLYKKRRALIYKITHIAFRKTKPISARQPRIYL
jgi:hypothetical protein